MTAIVEDGALVRVTERSVCGDRDIDNEAAVPGVDYTVYEFCPEGEGDDPEGRAYYLLDVRDSFGGSNWSYPEHVEVVKTKAELDAREIPDIEAATKILLSGIMSTFGSDEADFFEGAVCHCDDLPGVHVEAYGRTSDGLGFGLTASVGSVWRTDD